MRALRIVFQRRLVHYWRYLRRYSAYKIGQHTRRVVYHSHRSFHVPLHITLLSTSPAMVVTQQTPALFKPIKVGLMALQHRVVLAPLTRFRAYASHVPGPHQASYYAQRASTPGSLLITEGTFISHHAGGYAHVPGIYTEEQIQAWQKVRIFFFCSF